jgi:hypothetical protein
LTDRVALVGLEEFGRFWLNNLGEVQTLEVTATDLGRSWIFGEGEPTATVSGTGSELYLRLMQRPSPVVLPEDWGAAVDGLGQPPKR